MQTKAYKIIILISVLAILISSFTVGRQIYLDREPTLFSFSVIHFGGYLFFLLMPVELLFIYYLPTDIVMSSIDNKKLGY